MRSTTFCGVGTYGSPASTARAVRNETARNAGPMSAPAKTRAYRDRRRCSKGVSKVLHLQAADYSLSIVHAALYDHLHLGCGNPRPRASRLAHHDALLRREPLHLDRHTRDHVDRARTRLLA